MIVIIPVRCKLMVLTAHRAWPKVLSKMWEFLPSGSAEISVGQTCFAVLLSQQPTAISLMLEHICGAVITYITWFSKYLKSAGGEQWVQGWFAHEWCLWMRVCYRGRLSLHSRGRKVCSPLPPLQRPGEILRHKGPSGNLFSTDA